jgi:hypothetical protein
VRFRTPFCHKIAVIRTENCTAPGVWLKLPWIAPAGAGTPAVITDAGNEDQKQLKNVMFCMGSGWHPTH